MNLWLGNVPDTLVAHLRRRAQLNRRSLQDEILLILEESVRPNVNGFADLKKRLDRLDLRTTSNSTGMIRRDRGR